MTQDKRLLDALTTKCPHCKAGHARLKKPDGVFHDYWKDGGYRLFACTACRKAKDK